LKDFVAGDEAHNVAERGVADYVGHHGRRLE
jgi:hypothetical protein